MHKKKELKSRKWVPVLMTFLLWGKNMLIKPNHDFHNCLHFPHFFVRNKLILLWGTTKFAFQFFFWVQSQKWRAHLANVGQCWEMVAACCLKKKKRKHHYFFVVVFYVEVAMILLFVSLLQPRDVPYSAHVFLHYFFLKGFRKIVLQFIWRMSERNS